MGPGGRGGLVAGLHFVPVTRAPSQPQSLKGGEGWRPNRGRDKDASGSSQAQRLDVEAVSALELGASE
eukprot:3839052-Rhodomonas_salina.1